VFAGELANAPSYDHVILVYDERLDESVALLASLLAAEQERALNFRVEINDDGVEHTPDAAIFLLSGLPNGFFGPDGSTWVPELARQGPRPPGCFRLSPTRWPPR
jgi:hypothetical protein